ncbi:phage holin family protein [Propionibacteriaceae bacterium Y2011]|uniref:phage holin family protein n=1 Tax=Microlunatus sp. Y2014 TaxID=3418488 RepID=UPI003B43F7F7
MTFVLRLVLNAIALGVATWLVPGIILDTTDPVRAVVVLGFVAVIFGLVNAIVKPVFRFFTNPFVWLTLGLFLLVINALMLWLTSWLSERLQLGWRVDGFWWAMLGALIVSVVSFVLNLFLPDKDRDRR